MQAAAAAVDDDRALRRGVLDELEKRVPFDAFAWLLTDPDTTVGTSPLAEVPCLNRLQELVRLRYTSGRRWTEPAAGTPHRPVRAGSELAAFLDELGGFDVLSVAFADGFGCWGFLDLWRAGGRFTGAEADLVGLVAPCVTRGLRAARAAAFLPGDASPRPAEQHAVLLLGADLTVRRQTAEAERELRALLPTEESRRPVPAAAYNVAAQLLAVEAGLDDHRPAVRTPVGGGQWLSIRAARLGPDIAVTLGSLSPQERSSLFCRAHGLTARETEVVGCLAEGDDTHTAAGRLHLSEHTIQDHLKSTFTKTGVRSRRELLALARG